MDNILSEEEKLKIIELRQHFRNCFTSPSGKVVLKHMLMEMRYFNDDIQDGDHEGRVLRNYANTLIERLGYGDNPEITIDKIIEVITSLPITS